MNFEFVVEAGFIGYSHHHKRPRWDQCQPFLGERDGDFALGRVIDRVQPKLINDPPHSSPTEDGDLYSRVRHTLRVGWIPSSLRDRMPRKWKSEELRILIDGNFAQEYLAVVVGRDLNNQSLGG